MSTATTAPPAGKRQRAQGSRPHIEPAPKVSIIPRTPAQAGGDEPPILCPFLSFNDKKGQPHAVVCENDLQWVDERLKDANPPYWNPAVCALCIQSKQALATSGRDPICEQTIPLFKG